MKSAAATNAKLSASLELFQTLDCEDVRIIRSDRVMLRINQKNALAYAAKFKNAHKTFPRGAYKRIKPERAFPRFAPGMSTQEYVLLFAFKNSSSSCHVLPIDFDALGDRPAALYENGALDFDVIEEPNEDYFTTQAAQDAAQVLATAQAMAAIQQASTPTQAQSQPEAGELVTCEAGDNDSQGVSMGNATGNHAPWAPVAQYIPANAGQIYSGLPVPPAFRGCDGEAPDDTTPPATNQLEASELRAAWATASQTASEQTTAPKAYKFKPGAQVQRLHSKSGKWFAQFRMSDCGLFELGFKRPEHHPARSTTYATARDRMAALQAMARAADAPTDTPTPPAPPAPDSEPAGGLGQATAPEQAPAVPQSETPRDLETDQAEAVGADFERVEPIRVDLAALIIKGVRPDDLVGMGVYCSGDRANPSGSGAITGFSHSDFYGLVVDVTLEDGRVWRAIRTSSFKDGWFSLNAKMHGAPYLAELAMGATLAKSKKSSAEELAKQAHAQALIDLAAQYPQLKRAENTYAGGKLAAVNMRVLLKAAFKGVKFSVTSDYSKVNVNWADGPTDAQVQAVIGRFDIGASDTQSDYFYTVDTAFSQLFGGVQYLSTYRKETDALIQEAINQVYTGQRVQPTVEDYRKAKGVFEWSSTDWQRRQVREALNTISKA